MLWPTVLWASLALACVGPGPAGDGSAGSSTGDPSPGNPSPGPSSGTTSDEGSEGPSTTGPHRGEGTVLPGSDTGTSSTSSGPALEGTTAVPDVPEGLDEGSTTWDGLPDDGVPRPTAPCPVFADGVVTFCPAGIPSCRDALVVHAAGAAGGPLALHWHGTYETPDAIMTWDSAALAVSAMVAAEQGLMVLPYADPAAPARVSTPFPWWVVCGAVGTECDRLDDFVLADEIAACAVAGGLVDPDRLVTSGMSAGGTMTSHLANRSPYLAGAVSWSGGLPPAHQPATPVGDVAVMVVHGGATDLYCGPGALGGGCYDFVGPSEIFAADMAAAGNFAFLCDHQAGHSTAFGLQGAEFLGLAHRSGHPWTGYAFGTGGNYMLDTYCYAPGDPSPWLMP